MLKISLSKGFKKQYKKIPKNIKKAFLTRLEIFRKDQSNFILKNHPLKGDRLGQWSINVTGDIRAIYKVEDRDYIRFIMIGSHSELY